MTDYHSVYRWRPANSEWLPYKCKYTWLLSVPMEV